VLLSSVFDHRPSQHLRRDARIPAALHEGSDHETMLRTRCD
jgi:hypothetical protein